MKMGTGKVKAPGPLVILVALGVAAALVIRGDTSDPTIGGIKALAAVIAVVCGAALACKGLGRWSPLRMARPSCSAVPIQLLGSRGLGDGRTLLVVDVAGERFLISSGRDSVVLLSKLARASSPPGEVKAGGGDA
ncbi:MAG: flagellar biosynthetic protein FliO [Thermodesulfobacteriota bacterium]